MSAHAMEASLCHVQFRAADLLDRERVVGGVGRHRLAEERQAPDMSFKQSRDLGSYFLVVLGVALGLLVSGLLYEVMVGGEALLWVVVFVGVLVTDLLVRTLLVRRDLRRH